MKYRVGIDLGGTNIVAGVVDENFNIISKDKVKTRIPRPADEIIKDMADVTLSAVGKANIQMKDIEYVGVGSPGIANPETGIIEYANNLHFENVPMSSKLKEFLGVDVHIANDANAAAYGESLAGAAKGASICVCVTLGTGLGGGIIIDNKIYTGFNHAGAELGHAVIVEGGEPCSCGRNGCWESYASATALVRQTKISMNANKDSLMWKLAGDLDSVNGRTAFDAMKQGDNIAKKVVDNFIRYLGCGVVNVINVFQPEIITIGGGISKEGDSLLVPLKEYVKRESYSRDSMKQTKLTVASLGNDAGVIGAAFLGEIY